MQAASSASKASTIWLVRSVTWPPCQAMITARHSPSTVSTQEVFQPKAIPAARAATNPSALWASTMPARPVKFLAPTSSRSSRRCPAPIA